jgi:hypothetical protein
MFRMVLSTAVVMATRAAAIGMPILAAIFPAILTTIFAPVFSAVFTAIFTTRRLVRLAGHGDRRQQRAGNEQGSEQL